MVIQQRQSIQNNIKRHYPHGEEIVELKPHIKLFHEKKNEKKISQMCMIIEQIIIAGFNLCLNCALMKYRKG